MVEWLGVLVPVIVVVDSVQAHRQRRSPGLLLLVSTVAIAAAGVALFVAGMASFDNEARGVGVLWFIAAGIAAVAAAGYLTARWIERRAIPDTDA